MYTPSPHSRSIRLPVSPTRYSLSPMRKRQSSSSLYADILAGPFLDGERLQSRSRTRIQEISRGLLPETEALHDLQTQLIARDQYIETLKERTIDSKIDTKSTLSESLKAKEKVIHVLCKEKIDLLKTIQQMEEEIKRRENSHRNGDEEKSKFKLEIEELRLENANLMGKIRANSEIFNNTKSDLTQLSGIIQGMTSLNTELNDKILQLNTENEAKNKEFYEAAAKAKNIEEMEKLMIDLKAEKLKLQGKIDAIEAENREFGEFFRKISLEIERFKVDLPSEFHSKLTEISSEFVRFQSSNSHFSRSNSISYQSKISLLQTELASKKQEILTIQAHESALSSRLTSFETQQNTQISEFQFVIMQLKSTISTLQKGLTEITNRFAKITMESEKVMGEQAKTELKYTILQVKMDKMIQNLGNAKKNKAILKELQGEIGQLRTAKGTLETTLLLCEQKNKADSLRIKVLNEELWKRDTHILKLGKEMTKLEEKMGVLRLQLVHKKTASSPVMREARLPRLSTKSKPRNSSKSLLSPQQSSSVYYEKLHQLLETIGKGLEVLGVVGSGEGVPWQLVRSVLGQHRSDSGNVHTEVVERLWRHMNELEDHMGPSSVLIRLNQLPRHTLRWLRLHQHRLYTAGELLSELKSTLRDAEHSVI